MLLHFKRLTFIARLICWRVFRGCDCWCYLAHWDPSTDWQRRRQEILYGGSSPEDLGYWSGFQGRSPLEAQTVCKHCLQIVTAETINIWKFLHNYWLP